MWVYLVLLLSIFLTSCAAVVDTPNADLLLSQGLDSLDQKQERVADDFRLRRAQYAILERHAKDKAEALKEVRPEVGRLESLNSKIEYENKKINRAAKEYRANWRGKEEISDDEPEWAGYVFAQGLGSESSAKFNSLYSEYQRQSQYFKSLLLQGDLSQYAKDLPQTIDQAEAVLKEIELEEAYKNYNDKLIVYLNGYISKNKKDLAALSTLRILPTGAPQDYWQHHNSPPEGYSGPSNETKSKARDLIAEELDQYLLAAVAVFANQFNSLSAINSDLKPLAEGRYSNVSDYASRDIIRQADEILAAKAAYILDKVIASEQGVSNELISKDINFKEKIKLLKKRSDEFKKIYKIKRLDPWFAKHYEELISRRLGILEANKASLITSIKAVKKISDLSFNLASFIPPEDMNSSAAKEITQALRDKLQSLIAFRPAKRNSSLSFNNFTAKDLNYETELTALYLGDFKNSRLEPLSHGTLSVFGGYLKAFAKQCKAYLPKNAVEMTKSECAREQYTVNSWGNKTGASTCIEYRNVGLGLYADPALYNSSQYLASKLSGKTFIDIFSTKDPFAAKSMMDDSLSLGSDMSQLVRMNKCDNYGLKRFEENLHRFVKGKRPLLLPGGETMALFKQIYPTNFNADSLNLSKLLDELIAQNSKGWIMNRYSRGSVTGIDVSKKSDGSPYSLSANYRYSTIAGSYKGSVRLTFAKELPECLYFSDARSTCRKPSRAILTAYQKGKYAK